MVFKRFLRLGQKRAQKTESATDWRKLIEKQCSSLIGGGFRPSGELTSSCFGEVRATRKGEVWPEYNGQAL